MTHAVIRAHAELTTEEAGTHRSANTHAGENPLAASGRWNDARENPVSLALLVRLALQQEKPSVAYVRSSSGNIA